ncbi:MAG: hypothetical protein M3Z21_07595, partial [Pseudomonadota bacterium]|nr:hypothetical protein [Pseudomonadota bacterium]
MSSTKEVLDRPEALRPALHLTRRFFAGLRRNLPQVLAGGCAAHALFPNFPLLTLGGATLLLAAAGLSRSRHPWYGPFRKPHPVRGHVEEWTRLEGPPDRGGRGEWLIGRCMDTGEELWVTDKDMRAHLCMFGTTGGGKTVALEGFAYQAMAGGSGMCFVDGKADPKTWFDLYSMARRCGREDDLLVLNFLTSAGGEKVAGFEGDENLGAAIQSNTFNPFTHGGSDTLTELVVSLMRPEGHNSDGMWRGRAEAMIRSLMRALVHMRDSGQVVLSVARLREYMTLAKIAELETDESLHAYAREQLTAYLNELPGYRAAQQFGADDPNQAALRAQYMEQAEKQHGFLTMQFTELLGLVEGTYGHIFDVEFGDVNFQDVIYNRRLLYVMLPALEKSPSSLANL